MYIFRYNYKGHVQQVKKKKGNKTEKKKKYMIETYMRYNWDSTETSSAAIYIAKESIKILQPKLQTRVHKNKAESCKDK